MDPARELQPRWEERDSNASSPGDITIWELSTVSLNTTEKRHYNETSVDNLNTHLDSHHLVPLCLSLLISLLGIMGNGFVFWFLCFHIKQKKFVVYFLNLALADLLLLLSFFVLLLSFLFVAPSTEISYREFENCTWPLYGSLEFGYFNSLFFLTAISVERCLSVQFPIWYHCQRPKHQSPIVCIVLWGLSCLLTVVNSSFCHLEDLLKGSLECQAVNITVAVLSFLVVIPLIVFSNTILFIKMWRRPQQRSPPKIYIVIVVSVFTFLVFVVPGHLWNLLTYFMVISSNIDSLSIFFFWNILCCSIHSTANPFIYFLVGRQRRAGTKGFIKEALLRVFKEETEISKREEETLAANTAESIM